MPRDSIAVWLNLTAVYLFLVWQMIKERTLATSEISYIVALIRTDAVYYPRAQGVGSKELSLFNFFLRLRKVMVAAKIYEVKPMQAANAGVAVEDFGGGYRLIAVYEGIQALLIERLSVRQTDFYIG